MVSSPECGIPGRFPIRWREFQWVPSMTKTSLSFPLSVVLALLVFAIDVLVPIPGSAEPVLYLWSIWIAARTGDLRWTLCMAVVVTLLATVAPLLSPTSEAWLLSLETDGRLAIPGVRAVVVMSIWGTVLVVLPLIKARRSLQQSQALLQAETVSQAEQLVQIRREKSAIELEAEQALRDSEALYHSLVEHLPLSVLRKDARLRYTFVNRRYLDYSGMSLERLLGRTDFELFPEDLAQRYRAGDEEVLSTGRTLESVDSYVDPRGEQRWIRVIKSPVYDAQRAVVGVQILASDVTARQQAEEALANSRTELEARHGELQQSQLRLQQQTELLQSILKSLADGVVVGDLAGRLMVWNPAAESLLGTAPGEAPIREWPGLFGLFLPDAQTPHPAADLPLARAIRGETVRNQPLVVRNAKHPEGRTISVNGGPLRDADGHPAGGVVVLRDITSMQQAEAEIRSQNADLETLLYVTSHDLREPLRAIENFSKLVCDKYGDRLEEQGRDFLARVRRGAQRLDRLLQEVLTLSRVQRTTQPEADVPAEELVADVLRQLEPQLRETNARVQVAHPLPLLQADRRWATRALYNLVGNALKYTCPGEPPEIEIAGCQFGQATGLSVADRGPGVPPEFRERIFQLFQRAVGREIEGTGAGLAIVKRVAERHGGRAWVEARDGGGSIFFLTFKDPLPKDPLPR